MIFEGYIVYTKIVCKFASNMQKFTETSPVKLPSPTIVSINMYAQTYQKVISQ